MNKIISALALLTVLAAATASCSSNKSKAEADSEVLEQVSTELTLDSISTAADSIADSTISDTSALNL